MLALNKRNAPRALSAVGLPARRGVSLATVSRAGDMPFATTAYFEAWLDAFGVSAGDLWRAPDGRGDVVIAYVLDSLSIGPLRISAVQGAANDHTARYDVTGEIGDPARLLPAMLKSLGASVASFSFLATDSRLLSAVRNCGGLWYYVDFCEDSLFVDCRQRWETFWASRGSTRHLWMRRERALIEQQGAVFRCLQSWDEIETVLPVVYEIEASGWKGREGSAIAQSPRTRRFYDRCIRHWAEKGWMRLFVLELKGEIVAFQIAVQHEGVVYQIKVGYDERHAKSSPGQVLQLQLLRWAFANPEVRAYDMLGGGGKAAGNKRKWATDTEPLFTLWIFRRNGVGLLAWLRFFLAPRIKHRLTGRPALPVEFDGMGDPSTQV
jgi:hypothetical protein